MNFRQPRCPKSLDHTIQSQYQIGVQGIFLSERKKRKSNETCNMIGALDPPISNARSTTCLLFPSIRFHFEEVSSYHLYTPIVYTCITRNPNHKRLHKNLSISKQ
eukprot:358798-Pyramimonas_sp.AAC.1